MTELPESVKQSVRRIKAFNDFLAFERSLFSYNVSHEVEINSNEQNGWIEIALLRDKCSNDQLNMVRRIVIEHFANGDGRATLRQSPTVVQVIFNW